MKPSNQLLNIYNIRQQLKPVKTFWNLPDCGVHTFVDSNKNQKLLKSEESFHNSPSLWVDGPYTDKNQFPFIVALIYRKTNVSATHFCGGTLLTNKLIVTATHCLAGWVLDPILAYVIEP